MADLDALARSTLARNRFMVLGTVDPSGRARVSPVWFSLVGLQNVNWLSSRDAHHSRNIQRQREVGIVVFDSAADPHTGQAVYLEATAALVPDDELADACAEAFRDVDDQLSHTPESCGTSRSSCTGRGSRPRRSTSEAGTSVTGPALTSACRYSSEERVSPLAHTS